MKYLVLDGDVYGEGELFTFDDERKANICWANRPASKMYILYREHAHAEPGAGQFQKGY